MQNETQHTTTATAIRTWHFDAAHTDLGFAVRHLMISTARGRFNSFEATATFDPDNIEAGSISVTIDAASIDTGNEQRDEHLRSTDFFDVETYPTARFESTSVERRNTNEYDIHGEMTIRDTTRPVTIRATFTDVVPDPFGGTRVGVSASTEINREEFGLTWNQALETGGVMVSENVRITIDGALVVSE